MRTTLALALFLTACNPGPDLEEAQTLARAASDDDFTVAMNDVVLERLQYYSGSGATADALDRRAEFEPMMTDVFRAQGIPDELIAVAFVESGFENLEQQPHAPYCAGLWQFIPRTAREYGLRVDETVDERRDPETATTAAALLLDELYRKYGDWGLAIAAYNRGPKAVDAAIAAHGTRDVWELTRRDALPVYAASVMAGVIVLESAETVQLDP